MTGRKSIVRALLAAWLISGFLAPLGKAEEDDFRHGLKLFEKKNYRAACPYFERSLSLCPQDPNVSYYLAVSCQRSGKTKRAQEIFQHVLKSFPDTNAAQLSRAFLAGQPPSSTSTLEPQADGQPNQLDLRSPRTKENAALPTSEKIGFERRGDRLVIKALINDKPMAVCFDTGAPSTFISLPSFQSLNLPGPKGPPSSMVAGPNGDVFPSWEMETDIKVGSIKRSHFPIVVIDNANASQRSDDLPALGQSFFGPYHYTIDEQARIITLTKIGSEGGASGISTAPTDPWSVPFTWQGRQMVVRVEVNGKPVEMLFDANSYFIALNRKTIEQLHLPMPSEAPSGDPGQEIPRGGMNEFEVESIRLGPITKRNVHVIAMSDSALVMPLLGQPFFSDYQYTIDNEHGLIHFLKR